MNAKELTNEELALALRTMKTTGISPGRTEKEYLEEAADRLENVEKLIRAARRPGRSGGDVIKRMYFSGG